MARSTDKTPEGQLAYIYEQVTLLQRRVARGYTPPAQSFGAGSELERNGEFGVPATSADRVALAMRKPLWYNTERGWWESYYVPQTASGFSGRGLVAGVDSGWYPIAAGPRATVFANGSQVVQSGGTFTNWAAPSSTGGGSSWRNSALLSISAGKLTTALAGRYRARSQMYYLNGSGSYVSMVVARKPDAGDIYSSQNPIVQYPSFGQFIEQSLPELMLPAGGYISHQMAAGGTEIGNGNSMLELEYVGPALSSL